MVLAGIHDSVSYAVTDQHQPEIIRRTIYMDTGLRRYDGEGVNNMDFILRFVNGASMHHCSGLRRYDDKGVIYMDFDLRFVN